MSPNVAQLTPYTRHTRHTQNPMTPLRCNVSFLFFYHAKITTWCSAQAESYCRKSDPGYEHPHTAARHHVLTSSSHMVRAECSLPSHLSRPGPESPCWTHTTHTRIAFCCQNASPASQRCWAKSEALKTPLNQLFPLSTEKPATPVLVQETRYPHSNMHDSGILVFFNVLFVYLHHHSNCTGIFLN